MPVKILVMGASLGGFHAISYILGEVREPLAVPLVIVQHRSPHSGESLRLALEKRTILKVREAQDKERLLPGQVYLAPADYHLLVEQDTLLLSTEAPVNSARPSVDVLFESAAEAYGDGVLAVILTGASADGAQGCGRVKSQGGRVIAQQPETAESPVMPRAAIEATRVDHIAPLEQIPALMQRLTLPTHG